MDHSHSLSPAEALATLGEGNRRYVAGAPHHPRQDLARRAATLPGQRPMTVILGCSDSRMPPEIIFDQGVGDLFVVRTAGHVLDDAVLASVEYAVDHLGVRLVLVLGHANCGAIAAALSGETFHGHVGGLVEALRAEGIGAGRHSPESAERTHVRITAERLRRLPPLLAPLVSSGTVEVRGALYHLDTGEVEVLAE